MVYMLSFLEVSVFWPSVCYMEPMKYLLRHRSTGLRKPSVTFYSVNFRTWVLTYVVFLLIYLMLSSVATTSMLQTLTQAFLACFNCLPCGVLISTDVAHLKDRIGAAILPFWLGLLGWVGVSLTISHIWLLVMLEALGRWVNTVLNLWSLPQFKSYVPFIRAWHKRAAMHNRYED